MPLQNLSLRLRPALATLGIIGCVSLSQAAQAWTQSTSMTGVTYPSTMKVEGSNLVLNGSGITYRGVAKLYTVALYVQRRSSEADVIQAQVSPAQLRFAMLKGMRVDEVGKIITKGVELNSSRDEFYHLIPAIRQMGEVFSHISRLNPGDIFTIEYVPKRGTMFFVNGLTAGRPINNEFFFPAVLRVWLGNKPTSQNLKDALLSHKPGAVADALEE